MESSDLIPFCLNINTQAYRSLNYINSVNFLKDFTYYPAYAEHIKRNQFIRDLYQRVRASRVRARTEPLLLHARSPRTSHNTCTVNSFKISLKAMIKGIPYLNLPINKIIFLKSQMKIQ